MKSFKVLATAGVTGVALAALVASPAFAWQPKGKIVKLVQNQTSNSALVDANDASSAVQAKPGDVLRYVIEVSNVGEVASNGHNDMAKTVVTDTLPAGVTLVSNPGQTQVTFDLGTIQPGQKVTKEFTVKVTADKDATVIDNKACFTGNSLANDNPQNGCDNAIVKVKVPETPPTPTPTPTPTPAPTPAPQPAPTLPVTGASTFLAPVAAVIATAVGYAARLAFLKRNS